MSFQKRLEAFVCQLIMGSSMGGITVDGRPEKIKCQGCGFKVNEEDIEENDLCAGCNGAEDVIE